MISSMLIVRLLLGEVSKFYVVSYSVVVPSNGSIPYNCGGRYIEK